MGALALSLTPQPVPKSHQHQAQGDSEGSSLQPSGCDLCCIFSPLKHHWRVIFQGIFLRKILQSISPLRTFHLPRA